ncbi:unnamed protein product [Adineta ricciae]|uniref:RING-type domain-containing protein n=1 Tax=Adineta ricciae TaxID=249248 RepID=A0A814J251_ADIRI|nr:unnamed protein product [Adineta ricciae]CAF1364944.1 unnamed protein product [Adineta ricciae]
MSSLECSLCHSVFHKLVIIPCGHTFDEICIQQYINYHKRTSASNEFACPLCRTLLDINIPLVLNQSVRTIMHSKSITEIYLIDIATMEEQQLVRSFLDRIIPESINSSEGTQVIIQTANGLFPVQGGNQRSILEMPMIVRTDMKDTLRDAINMLQQMKQDANVNTCKLCILTRGNKIRADKNMIDKNIINKCYIVHVGDKNLRLARQFANDIDGHFNQTTLDAFTEHFRFYF